jgi:hypothetical protein
MAAAFNHANISGWIFRRTAEKLFDSIDKFHGDSWKNDGTRKSLGGIL